MRESMDQRRDAVVSYQVEFEALDLALYTEEDATAELDDPITYLYKATADPDTMYYHEAMKEPEVNDHGA